MKKVIISAIFSLLTLFANAQYFGLAGFSPYQSNSSEYAIIIEMDPSADTMQYGIETQLFLWPDTNFNQMIKDSFRFTTGLYDTIGFNGLSANSTYFFNLALSPTTAYYQVDERRFSFTTTSVGIMEINQSQCLIEGQQGVVKITTKDPTFNGVICTLLSLDGRKIAKAQLTLGTSEIPCLSSGMYLVLLQGKDGQEIKKVIVY